MSTAFRYLVHARDRLYRSGLLRTRRLNYPVVSVGNLTLGGTGKTPLVIALAQQLRARGLRPVILSRGYKRQGRGIIVAGNSWKECGDEPYLMSRRLKDVPVIVCSSRLEAGLFAEKEQLGNVFVLDDGFQHRKLHRDMDIVTIDPVEWFNGEQLLPTGVWREPKSAIERAHAACIQEIPGVLMPRLSIPSFSVTTSIDGLFSNGEPVEVDRIAGRKVVAFAGIAKPDRFFETLESIGIKPARTIRFRDHHSYSENDIESIGSDVLITTEKDAVRLQGVRLPGLLELRISARITDAEGLLEIVFQKIAGTQLRPHPENTFE